MIKKNSTKVREECGVFGISNINDASALAALGLHALQHRGQEGCGIVSYDGKNYYSEKRFGLVGDNFNNEETIKKLPGSYAIGHNRYSTTGGKILRNVQPFFADTNAGGIGVSHNGNFTNAITLRKELVKDGAIFYTTSDSETIVQLIARSKKEKNIDKIIEAISQIQGGYALVMLTKDVLIGARDIYGIILFSVLFYFSYIAFFKNYIDGKNRIMNLNISIYENLMYKDQKVEKINKKDQSTKEKNNDKQELY